MKLLMTLAALAAGSLLSVSALANDAPQGELGPALGETIPHDLSLATAEGDKKNFDSLTGEKGMALFFIRSVDWCPYCQAQAIEVDGRTEEFQDRGLKVVFLSYDPPEEQQAFIKRRKIKSVLLSDIESEVIKEFGLLNENYEAGSRGYGVPHPAVFIVSNDREVAAKLYESDFLSNDKSYRNRPAVDLILETVDAAVADGKL